MTAPKRANDLNLQPCWKVRIHIRGGGVIHVLSSTEPSVIRDNGQVERVDLDCICGSEHGDTIGFIDWSEASAVTWRYAPLAEKDYHK